MPTTFISYVSEELAPVSLRRASARVGVDPTIRHCRGDLRKRNMRWTPSVGQKASVPRMERWADPGAGPKAAFHSGPASALGFLAHKTVYYVIKFRIAGRIWHTDRMAFRNPGTFGELHNSAGV